MGLRCLLVRRLVFHLVRCFSSGTCGFGQLPLPQVACLRILPPYAWPATAPVASVGLQPSPCVLSASPVPAGLLGFAGFFTLSGSSHGGCDCSLGDSVGLPYGSPSLSSFVSSSVISSCGSHPLWVLCSVHCLVSFALGGCASGLRCLQCLFAVGPAVSDAPRGWSSFSGLCWSFTCSCGGVVWSHICGPSCCSCVSGYCGVSVALLCRLGLLRALPCRVFACGFPLFCGPSSGCFLGLFTVVLSSHLR